MSAPWRTRVGSVTLGVLLVSVACSDDAAAPGPVGDVGVEDASVDTPETGSTCTPCSQTAPCDPASVVCLCGANEVQLDLCIDGCCLEGSRDALCEVACCDPEVEAGRQCQPSTEFCVQVAFDCLTNACVERARDCDDSDPCTRDTCDSARGACLHERVITTPEEGSSRGQCSNGVDDDCDGFVDGADRGCGECFDDGDCEDDNPCTLPHCVGRVCRNEPAGDIACDDGRACTVGDGCDLLGVCVGTPVDLDLDGFGDAQCGGLDCDDTDPDVSPRAAETGPTCADGLDNNCSGAFDELDVECLEVTCPAGHWCKERPTPRRFEVLASHAVSPSSIWAVGELGALWHWDGSRWIWDSPSVDAPALTGVWAVSDSDVWAVSETGQIFRRRGAWTEIDSPFGVHLSAVAGLDDAIWVVGDEGAAARFDGAAWTVIAPPVPLTDDLLAVTPLGPGMALAAGRGGALRRLDARGATPTVSPILDVTAEDIETLVHLADGEIWGGASGGAVLRWDQTRWSVLQLPTTEDVKTLWGTAGQDVWAQAGEVLYRFDGESWGLEQPPPPRTRIIAGFSDGPRWAVGTEGLWYTRQAEQWVRYSDTLAGEGGREALAALAPDDVWASGGREFMLHRDGRRWVPHRVGWNNVITAMWAPDPEEIWAVGGDASTDDDGIFVRFDGDAWSVVAYVPEATFADLHGANDQAIWLVGSPAGSPERGTIYVWDGRELSPLRETDFPLTTIWVESPTNIWVAGRGGSLHFDDNSGWVEVPTSVTINDLWMSPSGRLWAAGGEGCGTGSGAVLFADGNAWTSSASNLSDAVTGIWGASDGDVWAVGCRVAHHRTASQWTSESLAPDSATRVTGIDGHTWVGGPRGEILHRSP